MRAEYSSTWKGVLRLGYTFYKRVHWNFSVVSFDIHLLHIRIHCCKVLVTDIAVKCLQLFPFVSNETGRF